jgi:hypothetical protein
MTLDPSNEAFPIGFKIPLKRWIESTALEGILTKSILLDTPYMYDKVNEMA